MPLHTISTTILDALWRASWQSAVLALFVYALRLVLGRRLLPKWRTWLWTLVFARALLPAVPSAAWSLFNLFPAAQPPISDSQIEFPTKTILIGTMDQPLAAQQSAQPTPITIDWPTILLFAWLCGIACLASRELWINIRFARRIRKFSEPLPPQTSALLTACAQSLGLANLPPAFITKFVSTPCLHGLFRPRILLPHEFSEQFSADEARFVFLHELAHVKRRDLLTVCLSTIARTLHWFNPFIWLAARASRSDMETACDEAVLALDAPRKAEYGLTLLKLATTPSVPSLPALGIVGGKLRLKRRIIRIAAFQRLAAHWYILDFALVVMLVLMGLTDARGTPATQETAEPSAPIIRAYDVSDMVVRLVTAKKPKPKPPDSFIPAEPVQLPPTTEPDSPISIDQLAALLRQNIATIPGGKTTEINVSHGRLFVTAPIAVQEAVDRMLADLRKDFQTRIFVEMRIFPIDAAILKNAGLPVPRPPASVDANAVAAVLNPAQADRIDHLLTRPAKTPLAAPPPGPPVSTPRIILFDNQSADAYSIRYIPYVGALNISNSNGKGIAAPVIKYAHDGFSIHFQARANSGSQGIQIAVSILQMRFQKFITKPISDDRLPNIPLSVQVALHDDHSAKTIVLVPPGCSALLAVADDEFAVVTPKVLPNH